MLWGRLPSYLPILLFAGFVVALTHDVRAGFEIARDEVFVDVAARQTTFTLTFNEPPDFFGLNESGQPNSAFQFFYDAEPSPDGEVDFVGADVVIVRGPEIHVDNRIPIRDSLNPSGEPFPDAEGWGKTLGEVDYELDGLTLSFTTPWETLRDADGTTFGYHLFGLAGGELTSEVTRSTAILVPLPPAVVAGAFMLLLALLGAHRMTRHR